MTNHYKYTVVNGSGYQKAHKDFELYRNITIDDIKQVDTKDLEYYSITIDYKKDKNNLLYIKTSDGYECVGSINDL
jgi:hypothetical protein